MRARLDASIRGTLIAWFGLLLVGVVAAFGAVLFSRVSEATMAAVDTGLTTRARVMAAALDWDDDDGQWDLELSAEYLDEVANEGYFVVQDGAGKIMMARGDGAPAEPVTAGGIHDHGHFRQLAIDGPRGSRVLVGVDVVPERRRERTLLLTIVASAIAVLTVAMLGGWWLARRSTAPIERLAAQAAAVSERDLGARLDATGAPAELHGLIRSFNDTLERLDEAFARQRRFTADASHELRTPVAVIRAQAQAALRQERTADAYRESLAACHRAATRMTAVVEGLLTLARADEGDAIERAPVDLAPVAEEAAAQTAHEGEADGITVRCSTQAALVEGDAGLLGEVVTNLVSNAVRYNRPGGRVDIEVAPSNGVVELRVRDTGIGIPAAAVPRLFDRFYRVDPARSRERGGSGLGLAITRWIVEAHGGEISVASTESRGSTFTVRLPRARS